MSVWTNRLSTLVASLACRRWSCIRSATNRASSTAARYRNWRPSRTRVTSPDWPYFVDLLNQTLHGNPFTIYSTRVFEFHTFAYGPLSLWLMAPFKLLSEALGAPPPLEAWLVWLPLFFADIVSGLLLVRLVRRWRPIAPGLLPFVYGMSGYIYLASALVLGAWFLKYSWTLYRNYSDELAQRTFRFSILYLSLLFAVLLVDHYFKFVPQA